MLSCRPHMAIFPCSEKFDFKLKVALHLRRLIRKRSAEIKSVIYESFHQLMHTVVEAGKVFRHQNVTYGMAFIMIKWTQNFILYRSHHQILPLLTQSCNIQNWKVFFLRQRFLFASFSLPQDRAEISTMKWKIRNECSCFLSVFHIRNLSSKLKGNWSFSANWKAQFGCGEKILEKSLLVELNKNSIENKLAWNCLIAQRDFQTAIDLFLFISQRIS